ncbi:hypothetical protein [Sphingobacterium wenxiniae]|uniref:Uncharacterized protein n=1 Tax=Sphingobacterium wenxiniae TaxID=683125 RepID=A0A1I6NQK2_9SPHI|nr:hypothetical protein [Sphingobacterium wenxiniae]SFS30179.1 hypothetical protein SAMN05660206_1014 [Sphingobacterium wenxiniae]
MENGYFEQNRDGMGHSELSIITVQEIWIDPQGNFYPGVDWMLQGYWSWHSKLSNMLPFDYWPSNKNP